MSRDGGTGLAASGYREKLRLCQRCGARLEYHEGEGFCCPNGHGCEWPQEEIESPEENKPRCYMGGPIVGQSTGGGRKRTKKKRYKQDFSHLFRE